MGISTYGGPGINLPLLNQVTNAMSLAAGAIAVIPAGPHMISSGPYCFIQFRDPITGEWRTHDRNVTGTPLYVESDGTNWRVANLTGCAIGARLTNAGSAYTSAPAVAFSAGGALATAIMGQVVSTTATIVNGGSGYTLPPTAIISAPPSGGLPAKASVTITNGAVSAITIVDQGAGYGNGPTSVVASSVAPTITIVPNLEEPSPGSIVNATATLALDPTSAGTVTAVLVTNPGVAQTSVPTISFSGGGGSSVAATAIMCLTVTAQTVSGGTGFGNTNLYTTTGGFLTSATAYVSTYNPLGTVRPAQGVATASAGALSTVTINDGGLFQLAPTGIVVGSALITASPTVNAPTMGGVTDSIVIQPA